MANNQSIPLFRLPVLAYESVIDILDFKEKFNLSAISNKSYLLVKRYNQFRKHKLIIFLVFQDNSARIFIYVDRARNFHIHDRQLTKSHSHINDSNSWVHNLGDDHNVIVDPTVVQVTQIASVAPTASLRLKFIGTRPDVHTTFIPLAKRLNLTLNSVEIYSLGLDPDDNMCRYVFENCRHAQTLMYHRETTDGFTLDPDLIGAYSLNVFYASYALWIRGNHLIKCFSNCKRIELSRCKLTVQDVNCFLKHWVDGSKVQVFLIRNNVPHFRTREVLAGITSVYHPYVHDKTFAEVDGGYIIKNTEGSEALIRNGIWFRMTTNFDIVDENF